MHHADLVRNGSTPSILSQRTVAMPYSLFEQEQNESDLFQILIKHLFRKLFVFFSDSIKWFLGTKHFSQVTKKLHYLQGCHQEGHGLQPPQEEGAQHGHAG